MAGIQDNSGGRLSWPKKHISWLGDRTLFISIPFTWNLPDVKAELEQVHFDWDSAVIGGPAVYLMPDYFDDIDHVSIGYDMPGVLQMINPMATRTTTG